MSNRYLSRRASESEWDEHRPIHVLSGCTGKDPMTWAQAKAISELGFRRRRRFKVYHCPFCRAWHVAGRTKLNRTKRWRQL